MFTKTIRILIIEFILFPALLVGLFGFANVDIALASKTAGNVFVNYFVVNAKTDGVDVNPGNAICETATNNGICTLRAAIQETNANVGADTIYVPAGIYTLSLPGWLDDSSATGDLDILDDLTITGDGSEDTIVDGNGAVLHDRVFHIIGTRTVNISFLTIRGGDPNPNNGGGIYNSYGILNLDNVVIHDNTARSGAGLINAGAATISNTTIQNNTSEFGGGIRNDTTLMIANSTISYNRSEIVGGGIENHGSVTLINSTVSHNQAGSDGGGIYIGFTFDDETIANFYNTTVTNNIADSDHDGNGEGGGVYKETTGVVDLQNTIIAGNLSPDRSADCFGDLESQGHNLIQSMAGCTVSGDTTGNIIGIDPNLGTLQDNDGLTYTHALQTNSPAIDSGDDVNCPETDQRGTVRPQGSHCDIGAYEKEYIHYVNEKANGANDGTSWADAYTDLQPALSVSSRGNEIWVAAGTYKPTTGADRTISFQPGNGVELYGGFAGNEVLRSQRNLSANHTTLSGDIGITGNSADNSYHVVVVQLFSSDVVLDGFTITGGNANGDSLLGYQDGGGIDVRGYPLTIINSTISNNHARRGAGMSAHGLVTIQNSTMYQNSAERDGGAIDAEGDAQIRIVNSTVVDNHALNGGALWTLSNAVEFDVIHSTFARNTTVGSIELNARGLALSNSVVICDPGSPSCSSGIGNGYHSVIDSGPISSFGLTELADHGGPTQTMALLPSSPLIDAGDDTVCMDASVDSMDQRGVTRPQGAHCDIGAYEFTAPTIRYVKWDASGTNNGTSWINAFTDLQTALAFASSGDEIWVAAGTYKPTAGTDRTISFGLENGVAMYGGFAGTEILRTQRNPLTNVTILSGDIGAAGDDTDNSYHVLSSTGTDATSVLDGFTVTAGNANGSNPDDGGGGLRIDFGSALNVANTIVINNHASYGAGIQNYGTLQLSNSTISTNSATNNGGGVFTFGSLSILDSVISNNAATYGGGILNYDALEISNTTIVNNRATQAGGAINNAAGQLNLETSVVSGNSARYSGGIDANGTAININASTISNNSATEAGGGMGFFAQDVTITITNSTFSGNSAHGGGGIFTNGGVWTLTNNSFFNNSSDTLGGGIENNWGVLNIINNTLSGNSAAQGGGIHNSGTLNLSNTIVANSGSGGDCYNGIGDMAIDTNNLIEINDSCGTPVINADPQLGPLANNGGPTQTLALGVGSPAINAATNVGCPSTDQRGVSRSDGACDIGAYEYVIPAPSQDDFDSPVVIPGQPYQHSVDVSGATQHADDPTVAVSCDGEMLAKGRASVWYKYTPSVTANVSLDTLGSNYDTYLAVWTGTRNNLSLVGCDNDIATSSQSQLSLYLTAGTPYFIEVAEYAGASPAATRSLTLHATTFADVPGNHIFWSYIEGFYTRRITTGCDANPFSYCPDAPVNRAAMAVFILRAKYGASHVPDPVQTNIFSDLPVTGQEWMQPWIEEFYEEGVTTGCGVSPLIYCPQSPVTREAMAVFLLRAKYGAGYTPPPASNPPLFADVPVAGKEWMQPWIEEFYRQGYTVGCGTAPLQYCPEATVNRAAMAVFISRVFNIPQVP